jgi:hypothetical protein
MARQRFAWSDSKGYTIKIFADTDQISYNPFEFKTASWSVTYDAQDAYIPGIVPSRMEIQMELNTMPFSAAIEQVARDAESIFSMELWNGLSKEWAGVITPAACSIEVINGTRFMTIIAVDGFYKLDLSSSMYKFTGDKRLIVQIAEIFDRLGLDKLFDGLAVSDTTHNRYESYPYTYDGLYHTFSRHALTYYDENNQYRTYREIINEFCICFGLRMYQDRGFIVFQDFTRINNSAYTYYNWLGVPLAQRSITLTQTLPVEAGGTKMYMPAIKELNITHEYGTTQFAYQPNLVFVEHTDVTVDQYGAYYTTSPGIQLKTIAGDGTTHFDLFNTQFRTRISYDMNYNSHYTIEFRFFIVYGDYQTDGTTWSQTSNLYLAFQESGNINAGGVPGVIEVEHNVNNYHLPPLPLAGSNMVWIYLEMAQVDGDTLTLSRERMKYDIRLHGAGQTETTYRADNTARILGEKIDFRTRLGDIPDGATANQAFRNSAGVNIDGFFEHRYENSEVTINNLLNITATRLAMQRYQPQEYYELDMRGTARMTHYGFWGNTYYIPISLTYTWDSCRATYAQFFSNQLVSSNLLTKRPTFSLDA